MNTKEASSEIRDFIMFNMADINNLMSISPDLASAFNNVLTAVDKKYASGNSLQEALNTKAKTIDPKKVAVKGDPTYGKELKELFKMFGGNPNNYSCNGTDAFYFITINGNLDLKTHSIPDGYTELSFEEFKDLVNSQQQTIDPKKVAVKGELTYAKELKELFKMFGGNRSNYSCNGTDAFYFINNYGDLDLKKHSMPDGYTELSFEEFKDLVNSQQQTVAPKTLGTPIGTATPTATKYYPALGPIQFSPFQFGIKMNEGDRPSPSRHARNENLGTLAVGNDGNWYKISVDKNGTKKWAKISRNEPLIWKMSNEELLSDYKDTYSAQQSFDPNDDPEYDELENKKNYIKEYLRIQRQITV